MSERPQSISLQGWLWKWTNYMKGYQRRWFVLSNGLLSYYRSQAEMSDTCRGTINLVGSYVVKEDECNFMVSNGASHSFHLKAISSEERQKWIFALEGAKIKAMLAIQSDDDSNDSSDDNCFLRSSPLQTRRLSFGKGILSRKKSMHSKNKQTKLVSQKLDELTTCNELLEKHSNALQRSLTELESAQGSLPTSSHSDLLVNKLKNLRERSTLLSITSSAMLGACSEFMQLSRIKIWPNAIKEKEEPSTSPVLPSSNSAPNLDKELCSEDEEFSDAVSSPHTSELAPKRKVHISKVKTKIAPEASVNSTPSAKVLLREYRTTIPFKPDYSLNLWNVLKNCIGKDLTKIPMPVNFNEPLSFLQRLVEDVEYYSLIDKAAKCTSSQEQMAYVVALSVSTYASTINRISKPFNPLLGETFELDRRNDLGFRAICEQVSHHPPIAAVHVESAVVGPDSGWTFWTEITVTSKFRGKYLSINPLGTVHLKFHDSGNHYTWKKITTTAHNIIVGTIWVDQSGDTTVVNHKTGDYCFHTYSPYSYFSTDIARKVEGVIKDKTDVAHYVVSGKWDSFIDCAKISSINLAGSSEPSYSTHPAKRLWEKIKLPPNANRMYYFSLFTMSLNQAEDGVAPTDSRLRPDQTEMEKGNWDTANKLKVELEDAQRKRIRSKEKETSKADDRPLEAYRPLWFKRIKCDVTHEARYVYNGKYWAHKRKQDWSVCPQIFTPLQGGSSVSAQSSTDTVNVP